MAAHDCSPAPVDGPTIGAAYRSLADWGFLAHPDLPDTPGPAFLLVALRHVPSLRHYDPETVRFWTSANGRGRPDDITRQSHYPFVRSFAWGPIQLIDRLRVTNDYLTFGGTVSGALVDDVAVVVFSSPAPLLRKGGHSQSSDEVTDSVGAFFGRVRAAIDGRPDREAALAASAPLAIYGAFIGDLVDRYHANVGIRAADPGRWQLLLREAQRLALEWTGEWGRGLALRAVLGLTSHAT